MSNTIDPMSLNKFLVVVDTKMVFPRVITFRDDSGNIIMTTKNGSRIGIQMLQTSDGTTLCTSIVQVLSKNGESEIREGDQNGTIIGKVTPHSFLSGIGGPNAMNSNLLDQNGNLVATVKGTVFLFNINSVNGTSIATLTLDLKEAKALGAPQGFTLKDPMHSNLAPVYDLNIINDDLIPKLLTRGFINSIMMVISGNLSNQK